MTFLSQHKLRAIGFILCIAGILSLYLEQHYYQYLDENSSLHESYFMPLGVLFIFFSILVFMIIFIKYMMKKRS